MDKRSKLPLGGAADLGGWLRGKRREGRGPPRPRARPRDGALKRSILDIGREWLASQRAMRGYSPTSGPPPACRATKFSRRPQGRDVGVDRGALRWPWGGGSGEAQLGLGSCGRQGWGLGAGSDIVGLHARQDVAARAACPDPRARPTLSQRRPRDAATSIRGTGSRARR